MPRQTRKHLFALGSDQGSEYALDLRTGAITAHRRTRTMPQMCPAAEEVTPAHLATLFEQAFYTTAIDHDGDLTVRTEAGSVIVLIADDRRFLRFMLLYEVREDATDEEKLQLVNDLCANSGFARFYYSRPDRLVADCDVPFERDIPLRHAIETFRQFSSCVAAALRMCDEEGVVAK